MFRIEVLDGLSRYVPAHWIHTGKLDLYFGLTDARKALREFPPTARIINVDTNEDVTGD